MVKHEFYDTWSSQKTRHGFVADEVISALQKEIRRGNEDNATRLGYEMYCTSKEMENLLWMRLAVISVEDICFGEPNAPLMIDALDHLRQKFDYTPGGSRALFPIHAIRYLCKCKKERSSDILKNIIFREFDEGIYPTIPDYAIDMHTQRGRELGLGFEQFLDPEGPGKVEPHMDLYDKELKPILMEMLAKEDDEAKKAFVKKQLGK